MLGMARPITQGTDSEVGNSLRGFTNLHYEIGRSDSCDLLLTNLGKGAGAEDSSAGKVDYGLSQESS